MGLAFAATDGGMLVTLHGEPISDAPLVFIEIDRRPITTLDHPVTEAGTHRVTIAGRLTGTAVHATWSAGRIAGDAWELTLELRNESDGPVPITRMDPLSLALADGPWTCHWYRSAWGDEFRPQRGSTRHDVVLDVRAGRSSHGMSPWLGLEREARATDGAPAPAGGGPAPADGDPGAALIVTPAWSGNWHIHALAGGHITAGISPWELVVELAPGESITAPSVVLSAGRTLDDASLTLQAAVRDHWLPRTPFTDSIPVEWNHWWPYEDQEVTEAVIAANALVAAELGIAIATVDAGWFGAADAASDWQEQRGDWHLVNTERFPSGLAALGQSIRDAGMLPGIWIEAEAVGAASRLRAEHPELLARRVDARRHDPSYRLMTVSLDPTDPTFLGYVCLGSAAGREHVIGSMDRLITVTGARWIKLDFNVDPDAGCSRTDHGHGAGDGLLRHVQGLYAVLDEVRRRHPEIVLESCSSGGLRVDLGLARHVHTFFMSDPDHTEHHLECIWGASRMLPPLGVLHWSWSQWRGDYPPTQLDWATLDDDAFDTMLRAAMLHRFGVSLRLTELRPSLRSRLAAHVALFQAELAPFVRDGVLLPLTPPPERGGLGERAPAAQLIAPAHGGETGGGETGGGERHLVAAFVLPGGARPEHILPQRLDLGRSYRVTDLATGTSHVTPGAELARGIDLTGPERVTSWLIRIDPIAT